MGGNYSFSLIYGIDWLFGPLGYLASFCPFLIFLIWLRVVVCLLPFSEMEEMYF
jgi:hypothetical protein